MRGAEDTKEGSGPHPYCHTAIRTPILQLTGASFHRLPEGMIQEGVFFQSHLWGPHSPSIPQSGAEVPPPHTAPLAGCGSCFSPSSSVREAMAPRKF